MLNTQALLIFTLFGVLNQHVVVQHCEKEEK